MDAVDLIVGDGGLFEERCADCLMDRAARGQLERRRDATRNIAGRHRCRPHPRRRVSQT